MGPSFPAGPTGCTEPEELVARAEAQPGVGPRERRPVERDPDIAHHAPGRGVVLAGELRVLALDTEGRVRRHPVVEVEVAADAGAGDRRQADAWRGVTEPLRVHARQLQLEGLLGRGKVLSSRRTFHADVGVRCAI